MEGRLSAAEKNVCSKPVRFINMIYGGGGEHHPSFWPWLLEVPLTVFRLVSNRSILVLPNHESVHSEGVG